MEHGLDGFTEAKTQMGTDFYLKTYSYYIAATFIVGRNTDYADSLKQNTDGHGFSLDTFPPIYKVSFHSHTFL
jgi:hypothetical protein